MSSLLCERGQGAILAVGVWPWLMTHQLPEVPENASHMTIAQTPADITRPARTAAPIPAPLRSRLEGSRSQPGQASSAKSHGETPAATGADPAKSGKKFGTALPGEALDEMAEQFWQFAAVYRPTSVVGVSAVLELAVCFWKNRRLFEQYAANHEQARVLAASARRKKNQRQSIYWFSRLCIEPRKALAQLEQLRPGLKLIIGTLANMVCELHQKEGTWSSSQFELALNLSGFTQLELWNDVRMRQCWGAWFGTFLNKDQFYEQIFRFQAPPAEYEARFGQTIGAAPGADEGRAILADWALELIGLFEMKLERANRTEEELRPLAHTVANWPGMKNSMSHLLHLRYANQLDRRMHEIQAILATAPAAGPEAAWELDCSLLPQQWREMLILKKPSKATSPQAEPQTGPAVALAKMQTPATTVGKPVEGAAFDLMMEAIEASRARVQQELDRVAQAMELHGPVAMEASIESSATVVCEPAQPNLQAENRRLRRDEAGQNKPASPRGIKRRGVERAAAAVENGAERYRVRGR